MAVDSTPASPARPAFQRWGPWLILLLAVILTGAVRFRLRDLPLERDEGEYAYAGQLILQGVPPYQLACNMKLPGTYYAYALGMAIFGQTAAGIHLTLIVVNSLIILFVYLLGRRLFGITAGLVAGVGYAAMSVSPYVFGLAAHANFFVLLFAAPATLVLWQALKDHSLKTLFYCGLLYGLALLMKQQGVCFGLFGGTVFILSQFVREPFSASVIWRPRIWAGAAKGSLVLGLGMVLPLALTALYLWSAGVFSKFWFWTFTYAHSYVAEISLPMGWKELSRHLKSTLGLSLGLWVLAGLGLVQRLREAKFRKSAIFAGGFWIFSFLAAAVGLYFRAHYFILTLPAFAILTGLAVAAARDAFRQHLNDRWALGIPCLIFAALLGWNVLGQADLLFHKTPAQLCAWIYSDNPFAEAPIVAQYLREHAPANARVAVVGSEPEIYFYSKLHSATSYLYTYPLMEAQPHAAAMQQEMMREIESARPEYLIYAAYKNSWLAHSDSHLDILYWKNQYTREFYDRVGVVETLPTGEIVGHWNDDAKFFDPANVHHFDIFQRKTP
jgi:hypothetical protein